MGHQSFPNAVLVDVPTGANGKSAGTSLLGMHVFGIIFPSNWVTSNVLFEGGYGSDLLTPTYVPVYTSSGVYTLTAQVASTAIIIPPNDFGGFTHIKIQSVTTQTATKTVTLLLRPMV